ncbi:hypothetical protein PR048_004040 [Dryococelus australis]|uniref:Retroviral polymerase SH3-like domain-containing protein n=1 Tax=Dryococelus australis TaxID=614101 RepID=A0ABQ9I4D4_9NEOP|nr:hypothetical protein PR048_004040 [Dryococelus australis]
MDGRTMGNLIGRLLMEEERVLSAKYEDSTAFAAARKSNPINIVLNVNHDDSQRLRKKFWAEAVNTAVYVINRIGTSRVEGKTPYQLWEGKHYDITMLKVFGLEAYVHISDQTRKKWDVKSKEGIFVGYSETSKGFRVFLPNENKVIVSCNVKFTQKRDSGEALQRSIGYPSNMESDKRDTCEDSQDGEKEDFLGFPNLNEEESNEYESVKEKGFVDIRCFRDRDSLRKPKRFDCDFNLLCVIELDDPVTFEEDTNSENSEKWRKAANQELENLKENNTWVVMERHCINADLLPEGSSNMDPLIDLRHMRLLPDFQQCGFL